MAQGAFKKSGGKAHADKSRRRPEKPKPKHAGVTKHEKLKKKMTSERLQKVESLMASRAVAEGRLTIMKKAAEASVSSGKTAGGGASQKKKGGSKK